MCSVLRSPTPSGRSARLHWVVVTSVIPPRHLLVDSTPNWLFDVMLLWSSFPKLAKCTLSNAASLYTCLLVSPVLANLEICCFLQLMSRGQIETMRIMMLLSHRYLQMPQVISPDQPVPRRSLSTVHCRSDIA